MASTGNSLQRCTVLIFIHSDFFCKRQQSHWNVKRPAFPTVAFGSPVNHLVGDTWRAWQGDTAERVIGLSWAISPVGRKRLNCNEYVCIILSSTCGSAQLKHVCVEHSCLALPCHVSAVQAALARNSDMTPHRWHVPTSQHHANLIYSHESHGKDACGPLCGVAMAWWVLWCNQQVS